MIAINHARQKKGELWQERFPSRKAGSGQALDHALRTVSSAPRDEKLPENRWVYARESG
jgi:hypothetical protein